MNIKFIYFPLAAGCKRTPKAELIRMDIVKKVTNYVNSRFLKNKKNSYERDQFIYTL